MPNGGYVFAVGWGLPGSDRYTVVGVYDNPEEAAEAASRECLLHSSEHQRFASNTDERTWLAQLALLGGWQHGFAVVSYGIIPSSQRLSVYVETTILERGSGDEKEYRLAIRCQGWQEGCAEETYPDSFDFDEDGLFLTRSGPGWER